MPALFHCSHCGFETKVKDDLAGKKIKCPKCKQPALVAAGADAAEASDSATSDGFMNVNLDSFQDVATEEGEVLDDSQKVKAPKKKRKKAKNAPLPNNVKVAAFGFSVLSAAVIAGLVLFVGPAIMENVEEKMAAEKPATPAAGQEKEVKQ